MSELIKDHLKLDEGHFLYVRVEVKRLLYLLFKINQQKAKDIMICYHKLVNIMKTMH